MSHWAIRDPVKKDLLPMMRYGDLGTMSSVSKRWAELSRERMMSIIAGVIEELDAWLTMVRAEMEDGGLAHNMKEAAMILVKLLGESKINPSVDKLVVARLGRFYSFSDVIGEVNDLVDPVTGELVLNRVIVPAFKLIVWNVRRWRYGRAYLKLRELTELIPPRILGRALVLLPHQVRDELFKHEEREYILALEALLGPYDGPNGVWSHLFTTAMDEINTILSVDGDVSPRDLKLLKEDFFEQYGEITTISSRTDVTPTPMSVMIPVSVMLGVKPSFLH